MPTPFDVTLDQIRKGNIHGRGVLGVVIITENYRYPLPEAVCVVSVDSISRGGAGGAPLRLV